MNTASLSLKLLGVLPLSLFVMSCSDGARSGVVESARRSGLRTVFVDFEALVRVNKPFPWQKGTRTHYAFVPSDTGIADLAVDGTGNLYVAGLGNVWRIEKSGRIAPLLQSAWLHVVGEPFSRDKVAAVSCIAANEDGSMVWIVSHDSALYVWEDATLRFVAGDLYGGGALKPGRGQAARMTHVYSAASVGDKVVVGCAHAICECSKDGDLIVLGGSESAGHKDGPVNEALFDRPRVVPHHEAGLWIVDWNGLRRLRDGVVWTLSKGAGGAWDVALGPDGRLYTAREGLLAAADDTGNMTTVLGSEKPIREFDWAMRSFAIDGESNIFAAYCVAF